MAQAIANWMILIRAVTGMSNIASERAGSPGEVSIYINHCKSCRVMDVYSLISGFLWRMFKVFVIWKLSKPHSLTRDTNTRRYLHFPLRRSGPMKKENI